MSYNSIISSCNLKLPSFSNKQIENLGNLQGHGVSLPVSFSDTPKVSDTALDILGLNIQDESATNFQKDCVVFQMDWEALEKRDKELPWYDKGPFIYIGKYYDIYQNGFNRKRLFDLLEEFGPYITALNFVDKPADASCRFSSPFLLRDKEDWVKLFQLCPNLDLIKTKEIHLLYILVKDPENLKRINQNRKCPIECPVMTSEFDGESVYLPTFSVGDNYQVNDLWHKHRVLKIVSSQKEVAFSRLSNDSWENIAKFLEPTNLKTWITTLTTAVNKNTVKHTLELIQKLKALLLSKEHGLSKKKIWYLIPQCGSSFISKLNLKGSNFSGIELKIIVRFCSSLYEIEIDKFNQKNLFELLQACGQYVRTLDVRKFDLTAEKLKRVFQLCPQLSTIKTKNLQILDDLMKDRMFLKEINRENNEIYHQAFIEYLKDQCEGINDPELIEKELIGNLTLCKKISEINIRLVDLHLTVEKVQTVLINCPHLIKLNLMECFNSVDDLRTILSHCQKLAKLDLSNSNIYESIQYIPSTLKELTLKGTELTNFEIIQLPNCLTHLTICMNPSYVFSNALARFTFLEVLEIEDSGVMPNFPRRMSVYKFDQLTKSQYAFFKSRKDFIKSLPSGLKELNIRSSILYQFDVNQIPKSLQKLSLELFSSLWIEDPIFIQSDVSSISSSLRSIKITLCPTGATSRALHSDDFKSLPQTLKSLTIHDSNPYSQHSLNSLPRDLEELNLIDVNYIRLQTPIKLPSRLKILSLIPYNNDSSFYDFFLHDLDDLFSNRNNVKVTIKTTYTGSDLKPWCKKNNVTLISE